MYGTRNRYFQRQKEVLFDIRKSQDLSNNTIDKPKTHIQIADITPFSKINHAQNCFTHTHFLIK